jgi:hypothetical protein
MLEIIKYSTSSFWIWAGVMGIGSLFVGAMAALSQFRFYQRDEQHTHHHYTGK